MLFRFVGTADNGRDATIGEYDRSTVQLVEHRLERRHLFGLIGLDFDDARDVDPIADEDPDDAIHPAHMAEALEVSAQCADLAFELCQLDR